VDLLIRIKKYAYEMLNKFKVRYILYLQITYPHINICNAGHTKYSHFYITKCQH